MKTAKYASESRTGSWGVRCLEGAARDLSPAAKCGWRAMSMQRAFMKTEVLPDVPRGIRQAY
jgi:hypothetical protein